MARGGDRKLGAFDATMLVMGGIVGVGIFFTPAQVAALAPHPAAFLGLWAVAALVALCGAATFAELGGTFPREGGWFEFLREIYGPFAAFLFAWVVLGVVATGAVAVVASFGARTLLEAFGVVDPRLHVALAALWLVAMTGVFLCGFKVGAVLQNAIMVAKLAAILALVVAGLALFAPDAPGEAGAAAGSGLAAIAVPSGPIAGDAAAAPAHVTLSGLAAALLPVFFAFGGWQCVSYVAHAVREPRRTVPRALVAGVLGAGLVYLALNAAFLRVLGIDGLAAHGPGFAAEVAERVFGPGGARGLRAALAVSAFGVCAVHVMVTPAIFVAMARHGLFFRAFGVLHARTGAPVLALLAQLGLTLGYLAWAHSDTLFGVASERMSVEVLTGSVVFAEWIFHGLLALGLMRLRARRPELLRPYTSFAFPLAPAVYLASALGILAGNLATSRGFESGVGLCVLALGAAVYLPWRRAFAARALRTD